MKVLTFSGSTPAEALKRATEKVGNDVMLIETKQIRKKSLTQDALYEIIVGIDEQSGITIKPKRPKPAKERIEALEAQSSDVLVNISEAAKQISKIADVTKQKEQTSAALGGGEPEELKQIKQEINKLGDKVKIIQNMIWEEKKPDLETIIPPEFSEIYRLAAQSGMAKEHLDAIMSLTLEHMPLKMRENSETVKRYFQTVLRKLIPVRLEGKLKAGQKKVIMLVGPTGVGKTTSIAKLAARYSYLLDKKYKVGLVVLDTYRIGAVEQLMQYARMMKLGIETVVDPPEFTSALRSLYYCDYILIDTMGSSPYDKEKIEMIYECLQSSEDIFNIEVSLVLPSSIKYDDLLATYENFSSLGIDTLLFTKLDETRGFGNIFSLTYKSQVPISYFSTGQEVPEDFMVASSEYLIDCLLNGFSKSEGSR